MARKSDPSGMIVYPKLPVPQQPAQRPSAPKVGGGGGSLSIPKLSAALLVALIAGGLAAWLASRGRKALSPSALVPTETVATLKEDKEWLKQRLT